MEKHRLQSNDQSNEEETLIVRKYVYIERKDKHLDKLFQTIYNVLLCKLQGIKFHLASVSNSLFGTMEILQSTTVNMELELLSYITMSAQ